MPDDPNAIDLTYEERRILGRQRGYTGRMLEHFIAHGGFEALDWSEEDEAAADAAAGRLRGNPKFRNPWINGVGPTKAFS